MAALSLPAHAADDAKMFRMMYKQAEKAFEMKNVAMMNSEATTDFTEQSMGKISNKKESMQGLKFFLDMFAKPRCTFNMTSVKVNGNTAVTMDHAHIWGMASPMAMKQKMRGKLDAQRDETLTWVKMRGKWMIKSMVASNEKFTMNGKPVPMGGGK